MSLHQTIELALKDRAPKLHAELKAAGKLTPYLRELASEANSQIVSAVMSTPGLQKLPYLEKVQAMNNADQSAREIALAQALEGLPDERSSPSQD